MLMDRRSRRTGLAGGVLLLVAVSGVGFPGAAASPAPQASLEGAASNLTRIWQRGSIELFAQILVASGIRLRLRGEDHVALSRRQAVAVLRDYLGGHHTESIRVERATEVGGSPLRGFAELRWTVVHEGASQEVVHSVYVGFVREDEAWRVFEFRVLE